MPVIVVAASFGGVILMAWLRGQYGGETEGDWPSVRGPIIEAGLALSGALMVAVLVGYAIDRSARERLAGRLAETWLWGLLGQDAPPQLQERAKKVLEQRIVLSLDETRIEFEWHDEGEDVLLLKMHSLNTGRNYGPEPFRVQPKTRVIPSLPGYESSITGWDFEVHPQDGAKAACGARFNRDALAASTLNPNGVVASAEQAHLQFDAEIQALRGDGFRLMRDAEVYLAKAGVMPLSSNRPTVSKRLVLSGPALNDLTIEVLLSGGGLTPEGSDEGAELRYEAGPALAGEWLWICWVPRKQHALPGMSMPGSASSSLAKPAEDDEAHDD